MKSNQKPVHRQKSRVLRTLLATAFLTNGIFQFIAPVLAEGTAAGTSISNQATATYEDPNETGTTINSTSNTVTVTVAEVAGITVAASGVTDNNGGSVAVGDTLTYTYTITNIGNDPTKFRIPNLAKVSGQATVSGNLEYSTDGGTTWTAITGTDVTTSSIVPGGSVLVRVPVTVASGAKSGDVIKVTLGDTQSENAQNVLRNDSGGDVYTVDNPDSDPNDVDGAPVNGVREASNSQQTTVGATPKNYSLATLLKVRTGYNNNSTPSNITDDKLTYSLSLKVENSDVTGQGINPAPLAGSTLNVDSSSSTAYILVSDAVPKDTELAATPTPPPGWDAVYTLDPVTTDANAAQWRRFTTTPPTLANVTRVGFINKPAQVSSIAPGTTITGFSVQVKVKSTATSPLNVANIAQVFGQTSGNNLPVYDESGDQNPSNYDGPVGNMTPPVGAPDANSDGIPDSIPDTAVDDGFVNNTGTIAAIDTETGIDNSNNNTGTTAGGDANVFTVQNAANSSILNGPKDAPGATGPDGTTATDFTNKSSLIPAGTLPGSTINPSAVGFQNTFKNDGLDAGVVTLTPTAPTNLTDLPTGTRVTITYGSNSAVYTYDSGTGIFTLNTGSTITIPNVAGGASVNYGVEVDLPTGTQLSTDIDKGFPVRITAAIDNYTTDTNTDGIKDSGNDGTIDASNITIDRVYTGFLKLLKFSRILKGSGPDVGTGQGNFESTPAVNGIDPNPSVADVPRVPAPGNIIEYQIRYKNISEVQSGTGNVILKADKVVITEDGTQSPNNWALDNDVNGQSDTSNQPTKAVDPRGTITFFSGNPANTSVGDITGTTADTDVTKYINSLNGTVDPQVEGNFTFQRKVN
ncbi:hypothetical protein B6N60_00136 [Richelia sinica FACHB-800]|uniref:DUF7925 domain-containing protein n=1 Tax=Richelia sinica FACHB-800 TaxID=1357546 RepID=A0A975Y2W8_9NOST|nr:hypothetical protein [Richelia sinica]MBD2665268.1 hypothetical protein [Richelia sinica FACHB-800]QXE21462.1 hypothetical protein B6N60_00136 [Richelia sinica FACHB-800]